MCLRMSIYWKYGNCIYVDLKFLLKNKYELENIKKYFSFRSEWCNDIFIIYG